MESYDEFSLYCELTGNNYLLASYLSSEITEKYEDEKEFNKHLTLIMPKFIGDFLLDNTDKNYHRLSNLLYEVLPIEVTPHEIDEHENYFNNTFNINRQLYGYNIDTIINKLSASDLPAAKYNINKLSNMITSYYINSYRNMGIRDFHIIMHFLYLRHWQKIIMIVDGHDSYCKSLLNYAREQFLSNEEFQSYVMQHAKRSVFEKVI
jgi:hypothetical protein